MSICKACGIEIMNGRELCKRCSQRRRSLRYWARQFDELMDVIFAPDSEEKEDIVIAS
jgi:ferredoxin